jgi:Protein of unknown function (DUF3788)
MGRSNAYWNSNLYTVEAQEPAPLAPMTDLTAPLAARFEALRTGLLAIEGVAEQVRFMGPMWRWAWEYGLGNRKLCWLHLMRGSVDVTFTLTEGDESRLSKAAKLSKSLLRAIDEGQRTGPVKWCWVELEDRKAVDAFLNLARRKADWLSERPAPRRAPRLHGGTSRSEAEAD